MIVDANAMDGFLVINPRSGQRPNADELRREADASSASRRTSSAATKTRRRSRGEAPHGPLGMAGGDGISGRGRRRRDRAGLAVRRRSVRNRNHFARDLGLDLDDPVRRPAGVLRTASRRIDVARVNGRLFLNNVSLGLYARLVHERDGGNTLAQLKALGLLLRQSERPRRDRRRPKRPRPGRRRLEQPLQPRRRSPLGERERLDEGASTSTSRTAGCPSTWEERAGRRSRSTLERVSCARRSTARPDQLETPLRFEIEPAALRVLLPEHG